MVIWSLQVAIRGTVSLTAYKTQLKNARHRLNEARGVAFFRWFNP
ncbi:transposase [Escherichia coli]|uniref:Transposase n=1 Tax=Escherichia coli TaxID=562 RepID=A0A376P2Q3_ECOLX|nr:transposase [Escherichia coli]